MSQNTEQIGIIGLGPMAMNLAMNFAGKKIETLVYNRTQKKTDDFIKKHGSDVLKGTGSLKELVDGLSPPRKIILLVPAGSVVDEVLQKLTPLLEPGDIVMDFGNSEYHQTEVRQKKLDPAKIHFLGCGISGGEQGALHGPSLMPGGDKKAWEEVAPILEKIAAKDFQGKPCVTYIGPGGAGNFVKTVHNGIEYGLMQIIAESYDLLRTLFHMPAGDIGGIFGTFNLGKLNSFLMDLASKVLQFRVTEKNGFLVEKILDRAGQKGTGMWTTKEALDHGVAVPVIAEAVFARTVSSDTERRKKLEEMYGERKKPQNLNLDEFVEQLDDAMYAAFAIIFVQGFELIAKTSADKDWNIDLPEIARIWQGGCIIRAKRLKMFERELRLKTCEAYSLLGCQEIVSLLKGNGKNLAKVIAIAAENDIAAPAFASSYMYFLQATQTNGSMKLIQAMRDAFGAHTYERTDKEGVFHTEWLKEEHKK